MRTRWIPHPAAVGTWNPASRVDPADHPRSLICRSRLVLAICLAIVVGCRTRPDYRRWADADVGCEINAKQVDERWVIPARPVAPDPKSRMADKAPLDCGPLPPDDMGAHPYMAEPGGFHGWHGWSARGVVPAIEFSDWYQYLPKDERRVVKLTRLGSMELALLHSREYQDRIEQLYFAALALTLEKFDFTTRWFATQRTVFEPRGTGGPPIESRTLTANQRLGFERTFPAGGQLLVDFANSFVWQFAGDNSNFASSGLLISFLQPVLRGAAREVRLEQLTQAERDLLYALRDFVRFRRAFYVNISGSNGYLGLLAVAQAIRNEQANLSSLERNLREHEQLVRNDQVAAIQVDQVFQQYQTGRLSYLTAQQALASRLDSFKIALGLPPQLVVELDPQALEPFELTDPRLDRLRERNEAIRLSILQMDEVPEMTVIQEGYRSLEEERKELAEIYEKVTTEWKSWNQRLVAEKREFDGDMDDDGGHEGDRDSADNDAVDKDQVREEVDEQRMSWERQRKLADRLQGILEEVGKDFQKDEAAVAKGLKPGLTASRESLWRKLDSLVAQNLRKQITSIFVAQTQIRVYLIEISPLAIDQDGFLKMAYEQRLDLMNQRARVTDAYRQTEVAADALEGVLDLRAQANLNTDPTRNNPLAFEASANRYLVGFDFEGPITRLVERNGYRAAQIRYQQARREFMASKDTIAFDIRNDIRAVEFSRFSFEIAREQLITAARQVDEAQLNLRSATSGDSSKTTDLLLALQGLLGAKNNLIRSWVQYETSRMNLFRDLDIMEITPEGVWSNEHDDPFQDNAGESTRRSRTAEPDELPAPAGLPADRPGAPHGKLPGHPPRGEPNTGGDGLPEQPGAPPNDDAKRKANGGQARIELLPPPEEAAPVVGRS